MAYMSQEKKAALALELKKVIPADWKWTLAVRHHSTLVLTIREAPIDLIGHSLKVANGQRVTRPEYIDVNEYYLNHTWEGDLLKQMEAIKAAMMIGNHDRSDAQSDHFDVGWYIDIKIGAFKAPFVYNPLRAAKSTKPELTYAELKAKVDALQALVDAQRDREEERASFAADMLDAQHGL